MEAESTQSYTVWKVKNEIVNRAVDLTIGKTHDFCVIGILVDISAVLAFSYHCNLKCFCYASEDRIYLKHMKQELYVVKWGKLGYIFKYTKNPTRRKDKF